MWGMHEGWGWWMVFGWLWFVLFWGSTIWLIVWVTNRLRKPDETRRETSYLEIAKARLARGEITEEEFQRLKQYLA